MREKQWKFIKSGGEMKAISKERVNSVWERITNQSIEEGLKIGEEMQEEQPYVMVYLLAVEGDKFNSDERSLLFFLGYVVWQTMREGDTPLAMVTEEDLEKIEEENFSKIDELEGKSLNVFEKNALDFIDNYPQINVFEFVMDSLMEEPEKMGDGALICDISIDVESFFCIIFYAKSESGV
jgi:hypothetical protein